MAKYAYFWGCYIQGRLPHIEKSTRAVMQRLGVDCVDLEGLTCCPEKTMVRNMSHRVWLLTAARNLSIAEEQGAHFVTPCPGCFGTLRGAAAELRSAPSAALEVNRELARIGRRYRGQATALHILDFLYRNLGISGIRQKLRYPMNGLRVAVHYGCHLLRPSGELAFDDPAAPRKLDELVEALGATSIPYATKQHCCGGLLLRAGDEETSQAMIRLKLRDVTQQEADCICLACPSCMMQYDGAQLLLQRRGEELNVPILYYTELLGLALGLEPEELGISSHRVSVAPFLQKWRSLQAGRAQVAEHWTVDLLQKCAECGACESDCPVFQADQSFQPNSMIRRIAAGEIDAVLREGSFWRCVECYTCDEQCFQNYSMLDIFRVAKSLATARGLAPAPTLQGMAAFRDDAVMARPSAAQRRRLGLPEIAPSGREELARLLGRQEERHEQ
jgi:CoB--CoM heterodisulfide reductase subunit B